MSTRHQHSSFGIVFPVLVAPSGAAGPGARKHDAAVRRVEMAGAVTGGLDTRSGRVTINISQLRAFCRIALDATWQLEGYSCMHSARANRFREYQCRFTWIGLKSLKSCHN